MKSCRKTQEGFLAWLEIKTLIAELLSILFDDISKYKVRSLAEEKLYAKNERYTQTSSCISLLQILDMNVQTFMMSVSQNSKPAERKLA